MRRSLLLFSAIAFLGAAPQLMGDEKKEGDDRNSLAAEQDQLLKDCKELEQKLKDLGARLEKSDRIEDRDRVVLLKKALTTLKSTNLQGRLQESADLLRSDKSVGATELDRVARQQKAAADELGNLLTLLAAEDREMEVMRMVQGYGRQMDSLQTAIRKQEEACTATADGLKKDKLSDSQKAATLWLKTLVPSNEPKGAPCDCPDRCGLARALDEARALQAQAETELSDDKPTDALEHQRKALEVMKTVETKLGTQLNQVRTEQIERLLATMQTRCQRMFDMQTTVRNETLAVAGELNEGGERSALEEKVQQLADDEDKIALEAHRATRLLEEEGTTLALPEIFYQLRRDMISAANRLRRFDVGVVTRAIQQDILDTLRETTDAIKKARRESLPAVGGSGSGSSSSSAPALVRTSFSTRYALDPLAEMQVIRGVLARANQRMDSYGKDIPEGSGSLDSVKDPAERARREMLLREKQEFEAWKKRVPDVEEGKTRLSRHELEKERQEAHFRELTCALQLIKEHIGASKRTEDLEKVESIDRSLKFADTLKPEENRPAKLLAFLATQKGFNREEFDRHPRKNKEMTDDVYAAVAHRLDEDRNARDQASWHEITIRTRDAQDRLQKQAAMIKQLK